jgi:hypothetical protein
VLKLGKFSALDEYDVLDFFATDCIHIFEVVKKVQNYFGFFFLSKILRSFVYCFFFMFVKQKVSIEYVFRKTPT